MNDSLPAARPQLRYTHTAMFFHWAIAAMIVTNFALAWLSEGQPKAQRMEMMQLHFSIGYTVLILALLRLIWRLTHRPPPFEREVKAWESTLAHIVHWALYVMMFALPILGLLAISAGGGGKPLSWFGLFNVPTIPFAVPDHARGESFGQIHGTLAFVLLGLLALHIAGAIKHHFLDRDGELFRMIPG
jgi:cytochrome b561